MTSLLIILYTNLPHPTALSFMAKIHYSKYQIQLQTPEFTIFGIDCLPVVLVDFDGLYEIFDLSSERALSVYFDIIISRYAI